MADNGEQKGKDYLKGVLKGKLRSMTMRRKTKVTQEYIYEKECKKANIDPEKLKAEVKNNKEMFMKMMENNK